MPRLLLWSTSWLLALVLLEGGLAAPVPEQQLADKYAPVVGLKEQPEPCARTGEPYRPVPVEVVLGRADVALVGPDDEVVKQAPTAADLHGKGDGYSLDFPGNPLDPECDYEQWFKQISEGKPTTAYAHILGEDGKLALQYWFYYPFNDWNNKHESDWEMIQLVFDAPTVEEALTQTPELVGYSQHEGAESASWDEVKLEKRDGHPVVYPGARSHANQFVQSLYLGHGAQTGFGCDDTRGPTRYEQTEVVVLPTEAAGPDDEFAWLGYQGRWGQKASGPNNGPTGPTLKAQWTEPITWVDDEWRPDGVKVPAAGSVAPSATGFFCSAVEAGSRVYIRFLRNPFLVLGVLAAIVLFAVWLSRRTNWSPALTRPIEQARGGGEIFRSGFRVYRRYRGLFLGIGVISVPLGAIAAIVQNLVFSATGLSELVDVAFKDPVIGAVSALLFGGFTTVLSAMLVYAACAEALDQIDEGLQPEVVSVFKTILRQVPSLLWATIRVFAVAVALTLTVIGIPLAFVYLVRKAVTTQAIVVEERGSTPGLKRSAELVRGHELRVFAIGAFVNGSVALLGPLIGVVLMFLTPASLGLINLVSAAGYVFVLPAAGIAIALLFYDLRVRKEGVQESIERVEDELPGGAPEPQGA